ncbi:MAG: nuclease-related domain-containing protein [Aggregatilineales bacterium]
MRQVVPSTLERRSRNLLLVSGLIILVGLFAVIVGVVLFNIELVVESNDNYTTYEGIRSGLLVSGIAIAILGFITGIRALTWRRDNPLAKSTGDALADFLDERFVFIRNVNKLATGYIDAVLVGPPGVLVFRITDQKGIYFNEGSRWMSQRDSNNWRALRWSPTDEAVKDIKKLREFFHTHALPEVPVYGVIVFTNDMPVAQITQQTPLVPVLYTGELSYNLSDSYFAKDRIDQLKINKITNLLKG